MKKLIVLAAIFFISMGCSGQKDGLVIQGKVDNPLGKKIVLQKYTSQDLLEIAVTELNANNSYSLEVKKVEPGFYRLNFFDTQFINLILNQDNNIVVNADGSDPNG